MALRRWLNLAGFLICALLLSYAYYSQFYDHLEPCPLCIFQRVGVIALGLIFLIAFLHHPGSLGARIYGGLQFLAAVAGGAVSLRHIYVQHLPLDMAPPCGPGLSYLFKVLPFNKFIVKAFTGTADCSIVTWRFLGLTMPEWMLIWFVILGVGGLLMNWYLTRAREAH